MRTQCTDRVHAIVVLQKKAGLVLGSNWCTVGGSFHCNLTISQSQPGTGCLFHHRTCKNMGSTALVSAFHVGGLGWVKTNGPTSISELSCSSVLR